MRVIWVQVRISDETKVFDNLAASIRTLLLPLDPYNFSLSSTFALYHERIKEVHTKWTCTLSLFHSIPSTSIVLLNLVSITIYYITINISLIWSVYTCKKYLNSSSIEWSINLIIMRLPGPACLHRIKWQPLQTKSIHPFKGHIQANVFLFSLLTISY